MSDIHSRVSRREAEQLLGRITYKPDHELRWKLVSNQVLKIWWEFQRPNCYNPSEIGVGVSGPVFVYLNELYTPEQLIRTVYGMTLRLEEHECREFFMWCDPRDEQWVRPFDPHKELI